MSGFNSSKILIAGNLLGLCWIIGVLYLFNSGKSIPELHLVPRTHRLYWFDELLSKRNPAFKNLLPLRNYTEINFNGKASDDKVKLAFADVLVREIVSANDTVRGLRFNFNDSVRFGTFIALLTILEEKRAKYYIPVDYNIWFFDKPDFVNIEATERIELIEL
jgi:hypothetical protein